jgi:hypothetical protein
MRSGYSFKNLSTHWPLGGYAGTAGSVSLEAQIEASREFGDRQDEARCGKLSRTVPGGIHANNHSIDAYVLRPVADREPAAQPHLATVIGPAAQPATAQPG